MENKEELLKQIEVLEAHHARDVQALRDELNKPVKGWSPSPGIGFSVGNYEGMDYIPLESRIMGLSHKSHAAMEKHTKFQKLQNWLYQLALELNEGWEPDWDNHNEYKYAILLERYPVYGHKYNWSRSLTTARMGISYFKDMDIVKKAIEIIKTWELDNE